MILSPTHRYVYVGIPRTASKSMSHWLCEHFDGQFHGGHHDYTVPDCAAGYLVFTLVRNPYDRATSGHFAVTWDDQGPTPGELGDYRDIQERLRKSRAILKTRQGQVQRDLPVQSPIPLERRIREAAAANEKQDHGINQKRFAERAGVQLALHYERLPACLAALPFVDPTNLPPFPHHPERGIRPAGTFFDLSREPMPRPWSGHELPRTSRPSATGASSGDCPRARRTLAGSSAESRYTPRPAVASLARNATRSQSCKIQRDSLGGS